MHDSARGHKDDRSDKGPPRRALLIAAIVVIALIGGGVYLVNAMVEMVRLQDCAMTGRSNC